MSETQNKDRISKYLSPRIQKMMFAELSPDYLQRTGALEILGGIAVPVGLEGSDAKGETDLKNIVFNMARVAGADPLFVYAENYIDFIRHATQDNAAPMLVSEGARSADAGDFEDACMLLRAALRIEPKVCTSGPIFWSGVRNEHRFPEVFSLKLIAFNNFLSFRYPSTISDITNFFKHGVMNP